MMSTPSGFINRNYKEYGLKSKINTGRILESNDKILLEILDLCTSTDLYEKLGLNVFDLLKCDKVMFNVIKEFMMDSTTARHKVMQELQQELKKK